MNQIEVVFFTFGISGFVFYIIGRMEGYKRGLVDGNDNTIMIEQFKKRNSLD